MAIKFFKKNIIDLQNTLPQITVSDLVAADDGSIYVDLMRNRNNNSGWATTDSSDAGTTTMIVDFNETRNLTDILLVGHNLKNYTLKYLDGTTWTNFSTTIAPTDNTLSTTYYNFDEVSTDQLQLVINGTQTADADKFIKQFIVTEILGTFSVQPEVIPEWDKDRKVTKFLSGKNFVAKSVGGFNCKLKMKSVSNESDLDLVESLFNTYEGFLVWLSGGDFAQFETVRQGYRLEDIFLMDITNEYMPAFGDGRWYNGMPLDVRLVEVS